jgi:tRNA 2-thiouridine synthesizing protein A
MGQVLSSEPGRWPQPACAVDDLHHRGRADLDRNHTFVETLHTDRHRTRKPRFALPTHMGYPTSPVAGIDPAGVNDANAQAEGVADAVETSMQFDKEFDASGLACPLPIVKTKKSLNDMTPGQVLRVVSTDPGSVCDMAAFAEQTGNALLESGEEGGKYVFFLKKA